MNLQQLAVRRPIALSMCLLAIVVVGIIAFGRIGVDLLPNIEYPTLAIVTVYPGADPESVESQVTQPIERTLSTVSGLKEIESISMESASLIMATFEWGTDLGDAFEEVNSLLSVASLLLPSDAERPLLVKLDLNQVPVLNLAATSSHDLLELTAKVEQRVVPVIERLPGVAQVSVAGGVYPQIAIYYDTDAMRRAGIDPIDLHTMLPLQNMIVPAGAVEVRGDQLGWDDTRTYRFPMQAGAAINSIEELRDLVVSVERQQDGGDTFGLSSFLLPRPVHLRDVAEVVEESKAPEGFTRINGEPAVMVRVLKEAGANTVEVSKRVLAVVAALNEELGEDLQLHVVTDQAEFINQSISNLASSAVVGGILAVLVLFLFLRSLRDILVIALSIPLSFIIAVILVYFSDFTLNLMTLGGLAIAVGMLVDNAIVVLENIFRLRAEGVERIEAAIQGAKEMGPAIFASTLTTIAVFVPLIFMHSLVGNIFKEMALSVTFALAASLVVALTVVPMLAAHLPERGRLNAMARAATHGVRETKVSSKLVPAYARTVEKVIKKPWIAVVIAVVFTGMILFIPRVLDTGFVPQMDGSLVTMQITLPTGTPVGRTDEVVREVEAFLLRMPEVRLVSALVGNQGGTDYLSLVQETPVNQATVHALLVPPSQRSRSAHDIAEMLRRELPVPEEAHVRFSADRAVDALGEDFAMGLTLEILGPDWAVLQHIASDIAGKLRQTHGFVEVASTADEMNQVLFFEVDRLRAGRALLPAGQVGLTLRLAMTGLESTTLNLEGRTLPVVIKPHPSETSDLDALYSLRIWNLQKDETGTPQTARLSAVATDSSPALITAPRTIRHLDRQRVATVTAQLDGIALGTARRIAEEILAEVQLPVGYEVRIAGIHGTLEESFGELWVTLGLAVLFVYMVMAAQFESLRYPGIVMISVPLSVAGGFAALWLSSQQLNVPAFLGLTLLIGIAVNNAIVLVDTIGRYRSRGLELDEAILAACRVRLRPILMTALTTLLALVPLSLGWGEGTEIQVPMAMATMGGLLSGTVLTLFVVPGFYRIFSGRSAKAKID